MANNLEVLESAIAAFEDGMRNIDALVDYDSATVHELNDQHEQQRTYQRRPFQSRFAPPQRQWHERDAEDDLLPEGGLGPPRRLQSRPRIPGCLEESLHRGVYAVS